MLKFRRRRTFRRKSSSYRSRRRILSRKKIKNLAKLVKQYSLPTKLKIIGMKESKSLVLRVVEKYESPSSKSDSTNYYQILLDPTRSPDLDKVKKICTYKGTNYKRFIYDYMKISQIVIVIRPIYTSGPSAPYSDKITEGTHNIPISTPIYGYYTVKNPPCFTTDDTITKDSWSSNPNVTLINQEGRHKTLFSFPYNTPITLGLKANYFRTNSNPFIVVPNPYIDLQNAITLGVPQIYKPFTYEDVDPKANLHENDESIEEGNEENNIYNEEKEEKENDFDSINEYGMIYDKDIKVDIDALDESSYYGNYGRVVLVSQLDYKFTVEILYKAKFYR